MKEPPDACKNRRRIYLLREGEIFPMILSLPTGSLKDFTRYIMRLLSKGKKSNAVVTKFTLKKATNNSGIAYSQAQFSVDRNLTDEEFALISGLTEQVKTFAARVGYDTLGLQSYLTAGPKESRGWTIKKGATAPEAAGVIHTDFQKGFIKAEVVSFDDLIATGSMAAAKAAGKVRLEGKDYVMADGDVVEFRHS